MSTHPTLRDVARLAGVSHQTVSRVINGSEDVLPETRATVEAAIERLFHYLPGAFGIALGTLLTLLIVTAMSAWSYALGARVFATDILTEVVATPDPR